MILTSLEAFVLKIYVGNISFDTDEATLRSAFEEHGSVDEIAIITDRDTGRPRGFAFVTMGNDTEARAAIDALNGKDLDGRALNVSQARAKSESGGAGRRGGGNW